MMTKQKHWLLLRGLGRDKRHWGQFVKMFEQSFPDDKVSTLDTCGNGTFAAMKSPLKIKHYTEHCRNRLASDEREVHLVALSLGGMIAMDWAQRYPDEVQSVTLINTSAANLTATYHRIDFKTLGKLVWTILFAGDARRIEHAILQTTSNRVISNDTLSSWSLYREQRTTSIVNLLRQLFAASRFKLGKLSKMPILVLASRQDRLVKSIAGEAIAEHLQCPIQYHPDAGHDLPLDDGRWIIDQIKLS